MKSIKILFIIFIPTLLFAQAGFNPQNYHQFLQNNRNLSFSDLQNQYSPLNPYYSEYSDPINLYEYAYFDSIKSTYNLTTDELEKLKKFHFVVTERLNYDCFGRAFHDIYLNDLPVFISTDAVLHALHMSYDAILMDLELSILKPSLKNITEKLYLNFPQLVNKYQNNQKLQENLKDVDLYVTIAKSLLEEIENTTQFNNRDQINQIWQAIQEEKFKELPLFSDRNRKLDFSQFTVRGHYSQQIWHDDEYTTLASYFKTMMWLGRMDFFLTPPPENSWEPSWTKEEIRRMNISAFLLNELLDLSDVRNELNQMDEIISFLVGESDNLTPTELSQILLEQNIQSAEDLLNDFNYDSFIEALKKSSQGEQKILSSILMMDPFSDTPGELPISFRLMGQRFIVDSYIFSNVVFDRIIFKEEKIWRPLPDPLDAMFVLGNDDALPLLQTEIDKYKYGSQLSALRFLVDSYDESFWESSLYNTWLQAIRLLKPTSANELPFFMQTTAWHQQKLNTQLASWAQLRHDNLLYAKQSYTGATGCSFPHSYIEPFPEFYSQIGLFAQKSIEYFSQFPITGNPFNPIDRIQDYFPRLKNVMNTLSGLAQKELDQIPFDAGEKEYLKNMLFEQGGSGQPPFSGWYPDLFYNKDDAAKINFVIADVHTQPTDQNGNLVGRVLHAGVGKVNLGIFLTEISSNEYKPMAFIGPVLSYYEKITDNFNRLTDEKWTQMVQNSDLPIRPDWINSFLIDSLGFARNQGRELKGVLFTDLSDNQSITPGQFTLFQNYPNPFSGKGNLSTTEIKFYIDKPGMVSVTIYNLAGQKVTTLLNKHKSKGLHQIFWNGLNDFQYQVASGIYIYQIDFFNRKLSKKLTILH